MKENVPVAPVATISNELPARVQEALGELADAAQDGLPALTSGSGSGSWPS